MVNVKSILLEGFKFELKGYACSGGTTTLVMCVSCNGSASGELTSWILELCRTDQRKENLNLVSCEKRRGKGAWFPAAAHNTAYELTGDTGISGIHIEESVGNERNDTAIEFRIVLEGEIEEAAAKVAYLSDEDIFVSDEKIPVGSLDNTWLTPIEKTYCLYLVVTDGYRPEGACRANVSIMKRSAFIVNEKGEFETGNEFYPNTRSVKTQILGSVKITACVPLKSYHASGDTVAACACDCFELCEILGYSDDINMDIKDVIINPKSDSIDITLLNSYCGKSVYRLDGVYVIECRHIL